MENLLKFPYFERIYFKIGLERPLRLRWDILESCKLKIFKVGYISPKNNYSEFNKTKEIIKLFRYRIC